MNRRDEEKRRLLDAVLPHVMFDGWSREAFKHAAKDLDIDLLTFDRFFPGGPVDMVSFFIRDADDRMEAELEKRGVLSMKIRDRITLAIRLRLEMYAPHKDAVRKALTLLALPQNAALGMKLTAGTVSRMWYATGDRSSDFSYYTKRLTLSAVYSSTLLYWLDDTSDDCQNSWGFLDRRIENVMQFEKAKFKTRQVFSRRPDLGFFPSPGRFIRNLKAR
ncbi:COQ9 family protein [Sneathiella chinensis]|uniref:COQ9 C-terminal domain-containing protein n=1 Tax=Sneathiella chinensis TaxID=349750 RepID=A0ABQ5U364_9PROT|nr:COQ9 family protein [Sneathiella chinensis]GLQ06517.1 hypothetical protein GCM10007924_17380 [Sneathiella chinensis]